MDQQQTIRDIEVRARAVSLTIRRMCELAKVHPTTFSRWKWSPKNPNPSPPTFDRLQRIWKVLDDAEAKAKRTSEEV